MNDAPPVITVSPRKPATGKQYIEWLRCSAIRHRPIPEEQVARAWQVAREAGQLLKERYRVNRVRVFGSLLHLEEFHAGSDVDLAVEGLTASNYWDALADTLFLDDEIPVDLVDPDTCPARIWEVVEHEGIDL